MHSNTKSFGDVGETQATEFLVRNGFLIVERNFYARKLGEIDIIAQKAGVLHFIEVKSSRGSFDPIYNITPSKMHKLINSAHYYLKTKRLDMAFCIDALIIRGDEIDMIENITL
jgi:putative endonuclease